MLRKYDWTRSVHDFEWILEKDSSHADVLYQYAVLHRYKEDFHQAFQLLHRQVELNEGLSYAEASIFRLYKQKLHKISVADSMDWLRSHPVRYKQFVYGEKLRQSGRMIEADSVLFSYIESNFAASDVPALLSRARIYYELERPVIAQSFVFQAIDAVENHVDGRLLFEDFKYLFTDEEMDKFRAIEHPLVYHDFFKNMLEQRNPARADEIDVRLQEHYIRLIEAEKLYAQFEPREAYQVIRRAEPYQTIDRDFPLAYWSNGELGDRGLVYVRHGSPDEKVASVSEDSPFIESWKYRNPDLIFHFEGHAGLGTLIPVLPLDLDVLEAREVWGGSYARLSQLLRRGASTSRAGAYELELYESRNELFDESLSDVYKGLSSDRYDWPDEIKHLDVPYLAAAFRGENQRTEVQIHYAIPVGQVTRDLSSPRRSLSLDVGIAVHDTVWNEVFVDLATKKMQTTDDLTAAAIDVLRFDVLPDSYHVNLHVSIDDASRKGSYQFDYTVPDFTGNELAISDLLPAIYVGQRANVSLESRDDFLVQVNPRGGFRREDPLYVFFEVYNLTFSSEDNTGYSITYTMKELNKRQKRKRRRRRNSLALSLTFERTGQSRSVIEYGELDVQALDAGLYELIVTVNDQQSGLEVYTSRIIELAK